MSRPGLRPAREERLEAELAELGCSGLLILAGSSRDADLAAWVGPVHLGGSFLVVPREGPPRLAFFSPMEREEAAATGLELLPPERLELLQLARELTEPEDFLAAALERGLAAAGLAPGRLALAGHGRIGVLHAALERLERRGWRFVSGNEPVRRLRKAKSDRELAAVRRAAGGVRAAFGRLAELLAAAVERDGELWLESERLTVARLRAEAAVVLARFGLDQPEGNLIAPGEEGGVPHNTGTPERVLAPGETLVVDLFPRGHLYADCTRTFCVGVPPEPVAAAHRAVAAALETARRGLAPGVRGWDLQEAVCALFGERGYATPVSEPEATVGYVHGLGHGVGFELHEYPSFRKQAGSEGVLAVGDVLTLEPGLYDPGAGYGLRLEDLIHLGADGPENLTPLPYALDPREWVAG